MVRVARALLGEFTFTQPDPIAEFGLPATVGLSLGVCATVCLSGASERAAARGIRMRGVPACPAPAVAHAAARARGALPRGTGSSACRSHAVGRAAAAALLCPLHAPPMRSRTMRTRPPMAPPLRARHAGHLRHAPHARAPVPSRSPAMRHPPHASPTPHQCPASRSASCPWTGSTWR